MHHFESHGVQFNYNGDYSGYIRVIDEYGLEYSMTYDRLVYMAEAPPTVRYVPLFKAVRDFVADSIRKTLISVLEETETDAMLEGPEALEMFKNVREKFEKEANGPDHRSGTPADGL